MLRFSQLVSALMLCFLLASFSGCGSGNEGTSVQVDEVREKALTDSMRGFYEKESRKETKKEPAEKK